MGLFQGAVLRAGNVHASTGSWPFVVATLQKLPTTIARARLRVRLDGVFYEKDLT